MSVPSRDANLERTKKWSFYLVGTLDRNKEILVEGEEVVLSGAIGNDGFDLPPKNSTRENWSSLVI